MTRRSAPRTATFRTAEEAFDLLMEVIKKQAQEDDDSPRAIARRMVGGSTSSYYLLSDTVLFTNQWADLTPECVEYKELRGWAFKVMLDFDRPLTERGIKFPPGRPGGALGPIAKCVARYLLKNPNATALQVWDAIKATPPKNYTFKETPTLGKYIEGPSGKGKVRNKGMGWGRFSNIVSEQRPEKKD